MGPSPAQPGLGPPFKKRRLATAHTQKGHSPRHAGCWYQKCNLLGGGSLFHPITTCFSGAQFNRLAVGCVPIGFCPGLLSRIQSGAIDDPRILTVASEGQGSQCAPQAI